MNVSLVLDYNELKEINEDFISDLNSAAAFVAPKNAKSFFMSILGHFDDKNLDNSIGNTILNTIRGVLQRDEIAEIFMREELIHFLPYENSDYDDYVFDIISDLLKSQPNIFDEKFVQKDKFVQVLQRNPHKALSIIATFAKMYIEDEEFETIINPWPLLDLLIKQYAPLTSDPELMDSYLYVVVFLNQNSDEYRQNRLEKCWERLVSLLRSQKILKLQPLQFMSKESKHSDLTLAVRKIYTALCFLRDEYANLPQRKHPDLPLKYMKYHLLFEDCQGPILALLIEEKPQRIISADESDIESTSFLSRSDNEMNPELDDLLNYGILHVLFAVAEKNLKASLVLMKIANSNTALAKKVFECYDVLGIGNWMRRDLPKFSDTIRLFLVIFKHYEIRPQIAENENFIPFLKKCLQDFGNAGSITVVCTIIRRIPLNEKFVKELSDTGLVKLFIKSALEIKDDAKISRHSLLLFINTIAEYAYLSEYLTIIDFVVNVVTNDKNLCEIASFVALTLARYPVCMSEMLSMKMEDFFKAQVNNKKYKRLAKNAEKFIAMLKPKPKSPR